MAEASARFALSTRVAAFELELCGPLRRSSGATPGPRGNISQGAFSMLTRRPTDIGMPSEAVDTPALLLDLDALGRNVTRMADAASAAGVRLRPHAKSHRCPMIALQQIAAVEYLPEENRVLREQLAGKRLRFDRCPASAAGREGALMEWTHLEPALSEPGMYHGGTGRGVDEAKGCGFPTGPGEICSPLRGRIHGSKLSPVNVSASMYSRS